MQTVSIDRDQSGAVVAFGSHVDVRKRGLVPVGSDLQACGVIHQMTVRAAVDISARELRNLETAIVTPAFESSDLTRGESCRDIAGEQATLAALPLDANTGRSIGRAMGGVHGCSHILALTQLLAAAVKQAIESESELAQAWSCGAARRLFHRSLILDGVQRPDGGVDLAAQAADLHFAALTGTRNPMEMFAAQRELRLSTTVDMERVVLSQIEVAERCRTPADLEPSWERRDARVSALCGSPFLGGFARAIFQHFPEQGVSVRDALLVDTLLALAPTFIQVCACFSEDWPARCAATDTLVGVGGIPDSCYMWRREGALHARKKKSDPIGTL